MEESNTCTDNDLVKIDSNECNNKEEITKLNQNKTEEIILKEDLAIPETQPYDDEENVHVKENTNNENQSDLVETQSNLCKQIFSETNKTLNIKIGLKLEELVNENMISIKDLTNVDSNNNNTNIIDLLTDLNENCLNAFDDFVKKMKSKLEKIAKNENVDNNENQPTISLFSESIKEWKTINSNLLTSMNQSISDSWNSQVEVVKNDSCKLNDCNTEQYIPGPSNANDSWNSQVEEAKNGTSKLNDRNIEQYIPGPVNANDSWNSQVVTNETSNINDNQRYIPGANNQNDSSRDLQVIQNETSNNISDNQQQRPGPNMAKLKEILERTGYSHEVSLGQRKYGGPPPEIDANSEKYSTTDNASSVSNKVTAPAGCECFVGKLPRDLFEDELIVVFEKHGRIWDLRLMIEPNSGWSKGYGFVTYCDKESAKLAAQNLNEYEIRPGKTMRVNLSVANVKLFVRNIPKNKTQKELKSDFSNLVEGVHDVIICQYNESEGERYKNRGFCFIEFIDHKSASIAKRKLSLPKFKKLFNREISVDWADQIEGPDEETMSKVKALYVRNLCLNTTESELRSLFEKYGKIERIKQMKDYAFIHFEQRDDALKAMEELQENVLGTNRLEISLAKPPTDKKKTTQVKRFGTGSNSGPINMNTSDFKSSNISGPFRFSNFNNKSNNTKQHSQYMNNNQNRDQSYSYPKPANQFRDFNNKNNLNLNQTEDIYTQNSNETNKNNNTNGQKFSHQGFNNNNTFNTNNNNNFNYSNGFSSSNNNLNKNGLNPNPSLNIYPNQNQFNNSNNLTFNKRKFDGNNDNNHNKKPRLNNAPSFNKGQQNNMNDQKFARGNNSFQMNQQFQHQGRPQPMQTYQQFQNNFSGDNEWSKDNFDSNQWI